MLSTLVLTAPTGATGLSPTYVALGDSYTSGAGLTPYLADSNGCSRSPEAYPEDVARALAGDQLDFVACSGATISQIVRQVRRANVSLGDASLVTLTAGGNDVSFSKLMMSCVGAVTSPTSSDVRYLPFSGGVSACTNTVDTAVRLLGASLHPATGAVTVPYAVTANTLSAPSPFEGRLLTLIQAVLQASAAGNNGAGARVLVVDYPMLLTHRTKRACLVGGSPIDLPDGASLHPAFASVVARELIGINSVVRRETAAVVRTLAGAEPRLELVNTAFSPLNCSTGVSSDLNGLSIATLRSGGALHPTALGQELIAAAVLAQSN
ncbi:MAG: GDSL-type esterase/lipase family protein [Acidimicrobiales bacterium]